MRELPMATPSHESRDDRPLWRRALDPYSDSPLSFGVLFLILMLLMVLGMLLYRFLAIPAGAGAHPTVPPTNPFPGLTTLFRLR